MVRVSCSTVLISGISNALLNLMAPWCTEWAFLAFSWPLDYFEMIILVQVCVGACAGGIGGGLSLDRASSTAYLGRYGLSHISFWVMQFCARSNIFMFLFLVSWVLASHHFMNLHVMTGTARMVIASILLMALSFGVNTNLIRLLLPLLLLSNIW